ncbi:ribokinase [Radiobacillus kanasensis]|uniref:ribokinase n=1 Tax=Radiobacillus kanasensis TaxID=2844358 RepID=UPI001E291002|nr:ribokinase [Radiobacillus kanasensis]UFT98817.1 ribokinase [Radiobacillus kanasensis]
MAQKRVTVIGSINMDITVHVDQIPQQGETIMGLGSANYPGGKGANQAVAAAKLGAYTSMIATVGEDMFGHQLMENLRKNKVFVSNVEPVTYLETGTAIILLCNNDNRIIVNSGANSSLTEEVLIRNKDTIQSSDVVLLQLEIPLPSVYRAAKIAKDAGVKVILNPAPYHNLPTSLLEMVDYITPNETEAAALLKDSENPRALKDKLIITNGEDGISFYERNEEKRIPSFSVQVKDTTGAGDAFNGAFAVKIAEGYSKEEACKFANAVAAISITKVGAQSGLPNLEEVENFITKGR